MTSSKVVVVVILVWRLVRRFLVRLRSWGAFICGCLLQGFLRRLVPEWPSLRSGFLHLEAVIRSWAVGWLQSLAWCFAGSRVYIMALE